jgi:hypothetical protein
VTAVDDAVREGPPLVVTSGGHCLEGFVSDPEVRVIIDVSPMKRVYYDAERRAVAVKAGATVGETFRALYEAWGVVVPLGEYPEIGMGGHVVGGAFGRAGSVVATRKSADPNRDLWWAHTGGGGGNFGIVTRYWFRSPDPSGEDPSALLPRAPDPITIFRAEWSESELACWGGGALSRSANAPSSQPNPLYLRQFGTALAVGGADPSKSPAPASSDWNWTNRLRRAGRARSRPRSRTRGSTGRGTSRPSPG